MLRRTGLIAIADRGWEPNISGVFSPRSAVPTKVPTVPTLMRIEKKSISTDSSKEPRDVV